MTSFLYWPIYQKNLTPPIFEIRLMVCKELTLDRLISQGYNIEVGKTKNGEPIYGLDERHREKRIR